MCDTPMECRDGLWICKDCPEFADGWSMARIESLHREDAMCIMLGTERPVDRMRRMRDDNC